MRSVGSITIPVAPLVNVSVDVAKGTDKYAGSEALREVCDCHNEPLSRHSVCASSGARRMTDALRKEGFGGESCECVKGVERDDGTFARVDGEALSAAKEAVSSDFEVLACVPRADAPLHTAQDRHLLAPAKKVAKSEEGWQGLHAFLSHADKALLGKWSHHGRQHFVAIIADGDTLALVTLRFAAELRTATDDYALGSASVDKKVVNLFEQIIDLPDTLDVATIEDESVAIKAQIVEAALGGKRATVEAPKVEAPAPDLLAALEASLASTKVSA